MPDCHIPYEDARAFDLMLKVAKRFKPDIMVVLGDFADCYTLSAHEKSEVRKMSFEEEVDAVNERLDELDDLGVKQRIFIEGNHEFRLGRYLAARAPELYSMVTTKKIFELRERGWKFVPYRENYKLGKLYITHDCGHAGKHAIQQTQAAFESNVVIGHTHRTAYIVQGNAQGRPHVAASFGWLGDAKQATYMHRVKANRDWSLGFGIGYLQERTGHIFINPVTLVNYQCVVEGKLYKG